MKKWNQYRIKNNRGEALIETIVSILIFTILMLTVSSTLNTALRITNSSTKTEARIQENVVNHLTLYKYSGDGNTRIVFSCSDSDIDINATHSIKLNNASGITAFAPAGEVGAP